MSEKRTHDEVKKMRRGAYIKIVAMVGFVAAVLAYTSIAWFTSNKQIASGDMSVKTSTLPFEIATKGASIRYENMINSDSNDYDETIIKPSHGPFFQGLSKTIDNTVYYTGENLCLQYDTGDSEIGPDSSGALSLYVIPKTDSSLRVKLTLDITAFAEIEKRDSNGQPLYQKNPDGTDKTDSNGNKIIDKKIIEITTAEEFVSEASANDVRNMDAASEAAIYVEAANYLKGHIMFFGGQGDTTNSTESLRYYYSTPYPTKTIDKTIAAGNEGKAVPVPIYWMWPNTFGQIASKKSNTLRNGYPVVADLSDSQISNIPNTPATDKEQIVQFVKTNKNILLKDWHAITLTDAETSQITESEANPNPKSMDDLVNDMIDDINVANNFKRLSDCYNAADYLIGTKVAYFLIEVTIEPYSE